MDQDRPDSLLICAIGCLNHLTRIGMPIVHRQGITLETATKSHAVHARLSHCFSSRGALVVIDSRMKLRRNFAIVSIANAENLEGFL